MATFGTLPVELRDAIWELSIPDTPEIYFFDLCDFESESEDDGGDEDARSDDSWNSQKRGPFEGEVITGFPAIMHLCQESRYYATEKLAFMEQEIDEGILAKLPCRKFQPELDAFFISADHLEEFIDKIILPSSHDWFLKTIKHLVLPASVFDFDHRWDRLKYHICIFSALRTVSILFDSSKNERLGPLRHFQLCEYSRKMGCLIQNRSATRVYIRDLLLDVLDDLPCDGINDNCPFDDETGRCLVKFEAKKMSLAEPPYRDFSNLSIRSKLSPAAPST